MLRKNLDPVLWALCFVLLLALTFARAVFPEYTWLTVLFAVLLLADIGALINRNRKALRSRTAAYGFNSVLTIVLVIALVGVVNFLASRYPGRIDMTKNKVHTLSDQTVKVVKGLKNPVKAVYFSKITQREQARPLLDNLKGLNPKFEVEYVDPDKEPARAKQVGIKKYGTLQLVVGAREQKIEDPNEEKVTNTLIKLLKDKTQTFCAITGHGERSFSATDAEGYDSIRKAMQAQSYDVKDVNLVQEGKIPEICDAIGIVGPTKAYFDKETKIVRDYLANGGRAVISLDADIKGRETAPEILSILADWHVKSPVALVIDPFSRLFGVDASVPIVATYSKDSPITRDFQGPDNSLFPFCRPLDIIKDAPAGMNAQWIARTTPKAWGETDFKSIAAGRVQPDPSDVQGPVTVAVTVEGKLKDSKAPRATRIVVFGSAQFANNNFSRFGKNLDFFMNAASWVLEDESLISIRGKEEGPGKVEMSEKQATTIFLISVILVPLLIAAAGVAIWIYRRKL